MKIVTENNTYELTKGIPSELHSNPRPSVYVKSMLFYLLR